MIKNNLKRGFLLILFISGFLPCVAQKSRKADPNCIPTGLEAMAKIERLPVLYPAGTKKNRCITYDAAGGNGFGLFQAMFKKYVDLNGEIVFFDACGPGCLYRQQMNIWINNGVGAKNKNIRIRYYFDEETTPRMDVPAFEFFNGEHAPVSVPFAFRQNSQFGIVYYPFSFEKRLRITLSDTALVRMVNEKIEATCNWFQFDYLTYPVGTKVKTWDSQTAEYEETVRKQWTHLGEDPKNATGNQSVEKTFPLRPGEQAVLFEHHGEASITGIQLQLEPFTAETFYNTQIRIQWDDLSVPSVDIPVSYFFGGGGVKDGQWNDVFTCLLHGYNAENHTAYCYWPMPFRKQAIISLVNHSAENIDALIGKISWKPASVLSYPEKETGYFSMKLTKDVSPGSLTRRDFAKPYANAFYEKGHGQVIAVNMWSGNFWEDGDEFTYIDGSRTPQIHGDGTEDDFNQGWAGARYQKPVWGALMNGVKGAYRIHLNEPYIYYNEIDMRFEHTMAINYNSPHERKRQGTDSLLIETEFVVWYYQSPFGSVLKLTDSMDVGNDAGEQAHTYRIAGQRDFNTLTQGYDSYESADKYDIVTDNGRSFDQYCEFTATLMPNNRGVRLRERINRTDNGIQTANVYVDGKKIPVPWYIATYSEQANRKERSFDGWFDSEYEIPVEYTKGKKQIEIRIEHVQSVKNELNSYYYWIYCYQ
ncbi:MAG: DUF2961 domain-containing protein [Tannerella sp.]|nr:DUF2961 domain-containing protein [Tannerella sp.]